MAYGSSTHAIAAATKLTEATVHTYLKRIYGKLRLHSRAELLLWQQQFGREGAPTEGVIETRERQAATVLETIGGQRLRDVRVEQASGHFALVFEGFTLRVTATGLVTEPSDLGEAG